MVEVSGRLKHLTKPPITRAPLLHTHRHQVTQEQVYHLRLHMLQVQGWVPRLHRHQEVYRPQQLGHTQLLEVQVHVIWRLVEAHPFMPLASQVVAWQRQLLQAQGKELAILRPQLDTSLQQHLQAMRLQVEAG